MKVVVLAQSRRSRARVCRVELPSGRFYDSPAFVAVGSNTLLKTVPPSLAPPGPTFINTFHALVHPGRSSVVAHGGLHGLFRCPSRVLFTDSGGFQVFSLGRRSASSAEPAELKGACKRRFDGEGSPLLLGVAERGVRFRSYRDGTVIDLTPESSIGAQQDFGSDVMLPLDELVAFARDTGPTFDRTHRWMERSLRARSSGSKQALFGIVHGGSSVELRRESLRRLQAMGDWDGFACGGSLGRSREDMRALIDALDWPADRPRHLLGIADPTSLRDVIAAGFDSFDSVFPTRAGRHGNVFVLQPDGTVVSRKIGSVRYRDEKGGLGPLPCECFCCSSHSAGLLHHLHKVHDTAVGALLTLHNVHVMNVLVQQARQDILAGLL